MSENKIDKNVNKVVSEVSSSIWMRRLFNLLLASVLGIVVFFVLVLIIGKTNDTSFLIAPPAGLLVFFWFLLKKW